MISLYLEVRAHTTRHTTWTHATNENRIATVQKIITEVLAGDAGMSFAKETRDLLIECCVEFITMISSEANEIAEKDAKKTIACEHIVKALEELGFTEYVPDLLEVAQQFKSQQAVSRIRSRDF
jgi:histone H3/H4